MIMTQISSNNIRMKGIMTMIMIMMIMMMIVMMMRTMMIMMMIGRDDNDTDLKQ